MKIALWQHNYKVPDIAGNAAKVLNGYVQACEFKADLVVFPEQAVCGYPSRDRHLYEDYQKLQDKHLAKIAKQVGKTGLLIGVSCPNPGKGPDLFNSATLIRNGKVIYGHNKMTLPTYGPFEEPRYFAAGTENPEVINYNGMRLGVAICEEIWGGSENPFEHKLYTADPVAALAAQRPELIVVINGSPWDVGKGIRRLQLCRDVQKRIGCKYLAYVNRVGCEDGLLFDGQSFILGPNGTLVARAKAFDEDLIWLDTSDVRQAKFRRDDNDESDFNALVLGVRDYVRKNGFNKVVIGLSGGIDSALTAVIAVWALGKKNVVGLIMPSRFSSSHSVEDAVALAKNLDIEYHIIHIEPVYQALGSTMKDLIGFYEPGSRQGDVTEENYQARIRGMILMAFSNRPRKDGSRIMVLTTGNKSEVGVGFCTLYGDMVGGYNVLLDVFKTEVKRLAAWVNRDDEVIPKRTLTKPPSAELRPNQTDQDSLPPYEILDEILKAYVEKHLSPDKIVAMGFNRATVERVIDLVHGAEFKRRMAASGTRRSPVSLADQEWRFPIAAK